MSSNTFFCLSFALDSNYKYVRPLNIFPKVTEVGSFFLQSFFSLCFCFASSYWCVLKFIDFFFPSAVVKLMLTSVNKFFYFMFFFFRISTCFFKIVSISVLKFPIWSFIFYTFSVMPLNIFISYFTVFANSNTCAISHIWVCFYWMSFLPIMVPVF